MSTSHQHSTPTQAQPSPQRESRSSLAYPSRTIVHAKLEMTDPGDHDEQEADAMANTIVSGGKIARKISGGGGGSSGIAVSQQMESQLSQLQGGGRQMPEGLRNMMESGFGQDFSQVRLHTDSEAANMSSSIHAKAFTLGNDIYFNSGQFAPETSEGQRLVAHELTHVVQRGGKIARKVPAYLKSEQHMINYLIVCSTSVNGYLERVDLKGKDEKIKQFVMGRDFVLKDGTLIIKAIEIERKKMVDSKMSKEEINNRLAVLRRIILKEQSGILRKDAINQETDETSINWVNQALDSIDTNVANYRAIERDKRKKQDIKLVEHLVKKEGEKISDTKKKGKVLNAMKSILLKTTQDEYPVRYAILEETDKLRAQKLSDKEIQGILSQGIINRIISISETVELTRIQDSFKHDNSTIASYLEKERRKLKLQGLIDDEAIDEIINNKRSEIIDDPVIMNIVFDDPNNTKYMTKSGKDNRTKFQYDIHKAVGKDQEWCDHFVHWCFLNAFDPNHFEGWYSGEGNNKKDKEKNDFNKIRQDILSYTMYEKTDTEISDTMKGSVSVSIPKFEKQAFINPDYNIQKMDDKFSMNFSSIKEQLDQIPNKAGKVKHKIAHIESASYTSLEKRKKWKEYAEAFIKMNDNYQVLEKEYLQTNKGHEDDPTYISNESQNPTPQKGDVVFFAGHIGLVVDPKSKANIIITIEGNTDNQGSHGGDGVYIKERSKSEILGYGRPDYAGLKDYLTKYYEKIDSEKAQASSQISLQETQSDTEVGVN